MVRPIFLSILISISCVGLLPAQEKQTAVTFTKPAEKTRTLKYLLSFPEKYDAKNASKKWPLLIFLHGSGERGDDLEKVKIHGPPMLAATGKKLPFIIISPQCPAGSWWSDEPVLEMLDDAEKRYHVDTDRIYLTGLSMGGYGTWHFAAKAPQRFAAVVPICGGGIPYLTQQLKNLPVWAFHGAKDTAVPLDESERLVKLLQSLGNKNAKLTVYPEAGHNSWTEAYNTPELYTWMLSHSRKMK